MRAGDEPWSAWGLAERRTMTTLEDCKAEMDDGAYVLAWQLVKDVYELKGRVRTVQRLLCSDGGATEGPVATGETSRSLRAKLRTAVRMLDEHMVTIADTVSTFSGDRRELMVILRTMHIE